MQERLSFTCTKLSSLFLMMMTEKKFAAVPTRMMERRTKPSHQYFSQEKLIVAARPRTNLLEKFNEVFFVQVFEPKERNLSYPRDWLISSPRSEAFKAWSFIFILLSVSESAALLIFCEKCFLESVRRFSSPAIGFVLSRLGIGFALGRLGVRFADGPSKALLTNWLSKSFCTSFSFFHRN